MPFNAAAFQRLALQLRAQASQLGVDAVSLDFHACCQRLRPSLGLGGKQGHASVGVALVAIQRGPPMVLGLLQQAALEVHAGQQFDVLAFVGQRQSLGYVGRRGAQLPAQALDVGKLQFEARTLRPEPCRRTGSIARSADAMSNAISVGCTSSAKLTQRSSKTSRIGVQRAPKSWKPWSM